MASEPEECLFQTDEKEMQTADSFLYFCFYRKPVDLYSSFHWHGTVTDISTQMEQIRFYIVPAKIGQSSPLNQPKSGLTALPRNA